MADFLRTVVLLLIFGAAIVPVFSRPAWEKTQYDRQSDSDEDGDAPLTPSERAIFRRIVHSQHLIYPNYGYGPYDGFFDEDVNHDADAALADEDGVHPAASDAAPDARFFYPYRRHFYPYRRFFDEDVDTKVATADEDAIHLADEDRVQDADPFGNPPLNGRSAPGVFDEDRNAAAGETATPDARYFRHFRHYYPYRRFYYDADVDEASEAVAEPEAAVSNTVTLRLPRHKLRKLIHRYAEVPVQGTVVEPKKETIGTIALVKEGGLGGRYRGRRLSKAIRRIVRELLEEEEKKAVTKTSHVIRIEK